jgi:predicted Fe-Mo cluster-binding NifX family protein
MRKVAIPISGNRLSEYFGECNHYEVFDIEGGKIQKSSREFRSVADIVELFSWLESMKVTDIIAFRIKKELMTLLASKKINLFVGVPQIEPFELIEAYLNGKLESDKNIINEITN